MRLLRVLGVLLWAALPAVSQVRAPARAVPNLSFGVHGLAFTPESVPGLGLDLAPDLDLKLDLDLQAVPAPALAPAKFTPEEEAKAEALGAAVLKAVMPKFRASRSARTREIAAWFDGNPIKAYVMTPDPTEYRVQPGQAAVYQAMDDNMDFNRGILALGDAEFERALEDPALLERVAEPLAPTVLHELSHAKTRRAVMDIALKENEYEAYHTQSLELLERVKDDSDYLKNLPPQIGGRYIPLLQAWLKGPAELARYVSQLYYKVPSVAADADAQAAGLRADIERWEKRRDEYEEELEALRKQEKLARQFSGMGGGSIQAGPSRADLLKKMIAEFPSRNAVERVLEQLRDALDFWTTPERLDANRRYYSESWAAIQREYAQWTAANPGFVLPLPPTAWRRFKAWIARLVNGAHDLPAAQDPWAAVEKALAAVAGEPSRGGDALRRAAAAVFRADPELEPAAGFARAFRRLHGLDEAAEEALAARLEDSPLREQTGSEVLEENTFLRLKVTAAGPATTAFARRGYRTKIDGVELRIEGQDVEFIEQVGARTYAATFQRLYRRDGAGWTRVAALPRGRADALVRVDGKLYLSNFNDLYRLERWFPLGPARWVKMEHPDSGPSRIASAHGKLFTLRNGEIRTYDPAAAAWSAPVELDVDSLRVSGGRLFAYGAWGAHVWEPRTGTFERLLSDLHVEGMEIVRGELYFAHRDAVERLDADGRRGVVYAPEPGTRIAAFKADDAGTHLVVSYFPPGGGMTYERRSFRAPRSSLRRFHAGLMRDVGRQVQAAREAAKREAAAPRQGDGPLTDRKGRKLF